MDPDHLNHLRVESARFLDAIRQTTPEARVPTCPDWTADDLLWHLGGDVQWFWASIIDQNLRELQQIIDLVEIDRPTDHEGLLALFTEQSARLHRVASAADPAEPRWMWVADPSLHHVGYITRRQAHEAFIHRVDAELTAGLSVSPVEPAFAADGVDEVLRLMHGNQPDWGTFHPSDEVVRVHAIDVDRTWLLQLGRFTGTDRAGEEIDAPLWTVLADDGRETQGTITGTAIDLDLWLWGRPTTNPPVLEGHSATLETVQQVIGGGVD